MDSNHQSTDAGFGGAEKPICLLVAGMHRGGTSACTRVINLMGAELPKNLMAAHVDFNPKGFWESNDIVAMNDALLSEAKTSWHDVLEVDLSLLTSQALEEFEAKLIDFLEDNRFSSDFFVLKDPRFSKLMPIWRSTLVKLKHDLRIVIPVRDPLEVAASLSKRDYLSTETSAYLWLRHTLNSIRHAKGQKFCIVLFEDLLRDWRVTVKNISQILDIQWPHQIEAVSENIDDFLDAELRHHKTDQNQSVDHGVFMSLAIRFFQNICEDSIKYSPEHLYELAKLTSIELTSIESKFLQVLRDYEVTKYNLHSKLIDEQKEVHSARSIQQSSYLKVQELEAILQSERKVFHSLRAEFEEKCRHVEILTSENTKLHLLCSEAQRELDQMREFKKSAPVEEIITIDMKTDLNSQLDQITEIIKKKKGQVVANKEKQFTKERRFNEAIVRADAQLDLLKQLFLKK